MARGGFWLARERQQGAEAVEGIFDPPQQIVALLIFFSQYTHPQVLVLKIYFVGKVPAALSTDSLETA